MGPGGATATLDGDVEIVQLGFTIAGTTEPDVFSVDVSSALPSAGNARSAGDFLYRFLVRETGVDSWTSQTYTLSVVTLEADLGASTFTFSLSNSSPNEAQIEGATIEISNGGANIPDVVATLVTRD